jgi:lysophospholipase L1-like esterase
METNVFFIEIGTNDQLQSAGCPDGYSSGSAFEAYLSNIQSQVLARNPSIATVYVGPANTLNSGSFTPTIAQYQGYAQAWTSANNAMNYSAATQFVSYANATAAGYLNSSDHLHPSPVGSSLMGLGLANLLTQ